MNSFLSKFHTRILIGAGVWIAIAMPGFAQTDTGSGEKHTGHSSMEEQVKTLQAEVARLKAAVAAADHQTADSAQDSTSHQSTMPTTGSTGMSGHGNSAKGMSGMGMGAMAKGTGNSDGMKMSMMGMEMGMKMMEKGIGMMKSMGGMSDMEGMASGSGGSMSNMGGSSDSGNGKGMMMGSGKMNGMGMKMMGQMPDSSMENTSLPGFPGASHIYHIGSSGFFLDHVEHLALTTEQQKKLNSIKEASVFAQNESDRQVESAEEALWKLTSEGEPDIAAIEGKLKEIAEFTVQKRLQFISSVGDAAQNLTEKQIALLIGEPQSADAKPESPTDDHQHDHDDKQKAAK